MFHFIKISFVCATSLLLLSACSDDNKDLIPEDADENFITSVVLTLEDETTYRAVIENNIITVTVPYTVALDGAKATFIYTESASILPNPETITDWDTERTFRVTSYNNDTNEYTYKVIKDEIRHEGDAVLRTAADVADFVASDVTVVKGNLIIGSDEDNAEPLEDISALTVLKEVEGNIVIRNSFLGADLTGLDNITSAGGLVIGSEESFSNAPELQIITMKSLQQISGDICVRNNQITHVEFEKLVSIGGNLQFNSHALIMLEFTQLTTIGNDLILEAQNEEEEFGGVITHLTLPELTTVGGKVAVNCFLYLKSISLPNLQTAGSLELETIPVILETIKLPELREVNGDLTIVANQIRGDAFNSKTNDILTQIEGLSKLTTVKGMLTVANFEKLKNLPDISNLTTLGSITLHRLDACNGAELDLSNVNFETFDNVIPSINITGYTNLSKIITQEDLSHVDIYVYTYSNNTNTNPVIFPEMNFKSVRNFTNDNNATADPVYLFEQVHGNLLLTRTSRNGLSAPNLTHVEGYMRINSLQNTNLSFPVLETVGGQLYIPSRNHPSGSTLDFSKLKSVGCAAIPAYSEEGNIANGSPIGTFDINSALHMDFPELERVGGVGFTIHLATGVSCPKLTTIDGTLCIENASRLTEIEMPVLTSLSGLYFRGLTQFTDFTQFGEFVQDKSIDEAKWNVISCGYNPTYQDMLDRKYTNQ